MALEFPGPVVSLGSAADLSLWGGEVGEGAGSGQRPGSGLAARPPCSEARICQGVGTAAFAAALSSRMGLSRWHRQRVSHGLGAGVVPGLRVLLGAPSSHPAALGQQGRDRAFGSDSSSRPLWSPSGSLGPIQFFPFPG